MLCGWSVRRQFPNVYKNTQCISTQVVFLTDIHEEPTLSEAITFNLSSAASCAILLMKDCPFTSSEFFRVVAGLSYKGNKSPLLLSFSLHLDQYTSCNEDLSINRLCFGAAGEYVVCPFQLLKSATCTSEKFWVWVCDCNI